MLPYMDIFGPHQNGKLQQLNNNIKQHTSVSVADIKKAW